MRVGHIVVVTPTDDPLNYDAKWRHVVAASLADNTGVASCALDRVIQRHTRFMRNMHARMRGSSTVMHTLPPDLKAHELVFSWFTNPEGQYIKDFIETLLLTDLSYEEIGKQLLVSSKLVELYEKLFYNVRDEKGADKGSVILKIRLIGGKVPDTTDENNPLAEVRQWKHVAATRGYKYLTALIGCNTTDDYSATAQSSALTAQSLMARRLAAGKVGNFDLNGVIRNHHEYLRLEHDKSRDINPADVGGAKGAWQSLIEDLGPAMVRPGETEESVRSMDEALKNKLAADNVIKDTKITDNQEEAHKSFTRELRTNVKKGN